MKLTILLGLIAFIAIPTSALASNYKVTKIHDGDTISVVNTQDNSSKKVRLACIDAPEDSQPQGRVSTVTLNAFIPVGTVVELNIVDTDRYGRTVAEVLNNQVNVNQSMLKKGQAIVYHKYLSNCPDGNSYIEAEKLAKNKKMGFWNDSTFITPEDWRRGERPVVSSPTTTVSNPTSNSSGGYVAGSCKYLKSLGLSRFTPGDPNYTSPRDRDNDGVACE
ncbi:MAG: thermonuclease family protein [Pleurocapsa sp.]